MTVYETLFGTPEKAARSLDEMALDTTDVCWLMDAVSEERKAKCVSCLYEYDRYGCEQRDMTLLEWLRSERITELKDENAELKKAMDFQALELGCMTYNRDILHLENEKLRKLLSSALIVAGFKGRKYLDTYLKEEEGTTLWQELKGLGIEV